MKTFISINALLLSVAGLGVYGKTTNNLRGTEDSNRELAAWTLDECKDIQYVLHGGTVNGKQMVYGEPQQTRCPYIKISGGENLVKMAASDNYSPYFYGKTPWTITEPFSDLFRLSEIEAAMEAANRSRLSTTKKFFQNFGFYTYRFLGVLYQMKQPDEAFSSNYKNDGHAFLTQVMYDEGQDYINEMKMDSYALSILIRKPEPDSTFWSTGCEIARLYSTWLFQNGINDACFS